MSPRDEKVYEEFLALPEDDREKFVALVLDGVEQWNSSELSPEWQAEIKRRIEACDRGEIELIPWEEVERRMNEKYGFLPDKP